MRRPLPIVVLILGAAVAASAGQRDGAGRPAVDPLASSISGRVTTADSGAPIRRAEVRAISSSGLTRLTTTDAEGRYEVRDLPAGTFRVHVSKSGFVPLTYGQRRPSEASVPVTLTQRQQAVANIALPRAGAIVGRVFDEAGEPLAQVRVEALRSRTVGGQRRLQAAGIADTTDDTGAFRIYALQPGDYYVRATPRRVNDAMGPRPASQQRRVDAASPAVFYPGTPSLAEAQRLTVDAGVEPRADIRFVPFRMARVTGTVLTSAGAAANDARVNLLSGDLSFGLTQVAGGSVLTAFSLGGDTAADGSFAISGVPPGAYMLRVTYERRTQPVFDPQLRMTFNFPETETAAIPVVVGADDVTGLVVSTVPLATLEVTVAADDAAGTRRLPPGISVLVTAEGSQAMIMVPSTTDRQENKIVLRIGADPAYPRVTGLPDGWAVKQILLDGEDVTEGPLQPRPGQTAQVKVIVTDRVTQVTGRVVMPSPPSAADGSYPATVVVFPDDQRKWTFPYRYFRTERATAQGAFTLQGLPPNTDYRAIAVDYLEDGDAEDPEFLERIRTRATAFSLREGERKTLELPMIRR